MRPHLTAMVRMISVSLRVMFIPSPKWSYSKITKRLIINFKKRKNSAKWICHSPIPTTQILRRKHLRLKTIKRRSHCREHSWNTENISEWSSFSSVQYRSWRKWSTLTYLKGCLMKWVWMTDWVKKNKIRIKLWNSKFTILWPQFCYSQSDP